MIIASIDIGTNTVLLLVAKVEYSTRKIIPIHNEYRMPRIGHGTKQTGIISEEKKNLLYSVLDEYRSIINRNNCEKVILTGTNAFRMARNTKDIISDIKKSFNYNLNVISGEEEAEYAYFGAISNIDDPDNSMVIDIGGSSTEIICGINYNILFKNSLQLGSVSSTEQFLKHSPPLKLEIGNFIIEIEKLFSTIDKTFIPKNVIGIAGTATTLACMKLDLREFDEQKVDKLILTYQDIKKLTEELSNLTAAEILDKFGSVMKGREDIIFAGACILFQFMEYYGIDRVSVGTRGIRYGAIIKFLGNSLKDLYSE